MDGLSRGFIFSTKQGNTYSYNDLDGTVTPITSSNNVQKIIDNAEKTTSSPLEFLSDNLSSKIENYLNIESHRQLLLIVTEQCNLRCRYCAYSGNYKNNRIHHNTTMSWKVAEKAIKRFYEGYNSVKIHDPSLKPAISFYGGEPLLNFELIRKVYYYAKSLFRGQVNFNLTTNATLLKQYIIDFFVENNFHLLFSLNGDKFEHNRLRVYSDGSGSFDNIWKNLQEIHHDYPKYYQEYCGVIAVTDIGTDLNKLRQFYDEKESILPKLQVFTGVNQSFTNWYSRYTESEYSRYWESYQTLKEEYFNKLCNHKIPSQFLQKYFGNTYNPILLRAQNTHVKNPLFPFTSTCIPGMKIAVSPDGYFHCCERINYHFPIGNIDTGLDIHLIEDMIKRYVYQLLEECNKCNITRLCPVCFAGVAAEGQFLRDPLDKCTRIQEYFKNGFGELWTLFENGVPESVFPGREIIREW